MNVRCLRAESGTAAWSEAELNTLFAALNAALAPDDGRGWETGVTENGDPQFYLLGPLPEQACELCVSRIGGRYILEDGRAGSCSSIASLALVALHAKAAVPSTRWPLVARARCCGVRFGNVIHDKVEPLLAEGEEMLVHLAPQLAAFV